MLTIYGSDLSGPANKVRFVANILGIPYEYRRLNLREKEHKQEWFLKINPVGKVPAISDGDFCLFESGAIVKYLCNKTPGQSLYPADPKQRAVIDQWVDFATLHITVNVSKVTYNRLFAPRMGVAPSQESINEGLGFLQQYLPYIEKQLEKTAFVAGNSLSLADVTLLAGLDPCELSEIDLSPYTKLVAYRNKLKAQDFYTKCFREYGEILKQTASK